jgi:hypothetical protein
MVDENVKATSIWPREWLSENVAPLCALIVVVSGVALIARTFFLGMPTGSEASFELFKYMVLTAFGYLFGKNT